MIRAPRRSPAVVGSSLVAWPHILGSRKVPNPSLNERPFID
jgi:hypothetical protein